MATSSMILQEGAAFTCANSFSLKRKRPPMIEIPHVLQELQPHKLSDFNFKPPKEDENVSFSGYGYGVFSVKGNKKLMEDTHKIVSSSRGTSKKGFFGVYDGHGGKKAAEFVAQNLHTNILKMMEEKCKESKTKEEAVKAGYLKTDQEFLEKGIGSGACCVTALIEEHEIVVSNLGDCRAVLCRRGVAEVLTKDHRVEKEEERKRIEDKGGYVEIHRGAWRVHGILSVSRSIGDAHLKEWVLAEPDTKILPLAQDMDFLVLASDGLWEEVGNQEAVDIVTRLCQSEKNGGFSRELKSDVDDDDYGCVNVSPSSKLRRISLIKQPRGKNESTTGCRKKTHKSNRNDAEDEFACENESPPSKSRRISMVKRIDIKNEIPNSCKKRSNSGGLLATACKQLVDLAVSRGTLDDVTVLIIDLNHFKCSS